MYEEEGNGCLTEGPTAAGRAGSIAGTKGKGTGQGTRTIPLEPYCDIRDRVIENPFYTYCANHPHRRPARDRIPIGPILRYAGDGMSNDREVWVESPDTEGIRLHLAGTARGIVGGRRAGMVPDRAWGWAGGYVGSWRSSGRRGRWRGCVGYLRSFRVGLGESCAGGGGADRGGIGLGNAMHLIGQGLPIAVVEAVGH